MKPVLPSAAMTLVALTGCTPPGFSRLGSFSVSIVDASEQLQVSFLYDQQKQGCQSLDQDFSAEMNGAPAIALFPGRTSLPFGSCTAPVAVLPRPAGFGETATITASAGGEALAVEIENIGMTLGARPVLAPGEAVHAGQLVHLALDPGWDAMQWGDQATVSVQQGSAFSWELVPIALPSEGVMDVQLPASLPPGPTHVGVGINGPRPAITRCEGPSSCHVPTSVTLSFDTIVETAP